jgi:hypothetical protein
MIAFGVVDAIEPRAEILKCDLPAQLQQLLLGEVRSQLGIQLIRNVGRCIRHGVGQGNDHAFDGRKRIQRFAQNRAQLLGAQSSFSANGRIDVHSKRTPDSRRRAYLCKLLETQRDVSLPAEHKFETYAEPNQRRVPHLNFYRGKIPAKHFASDPIKPAQMPRRFRTFKSNHSRHSNTP